MNIKIQEFEPQYTEEVIALILGIQVGEFGVATSRAEQPDLLQIPEYYQNSGGQFWLAFVDDKLVGSVALKPFTARQAALRKMFVAKDYRGAKYHLAQQLVDKLSQFAVEHGIEEIYLGTTKKYHAAHRFYEKNGFSSIAQVKLPNNFPLFLVDDCFYAKKISQYSLIERAFQFVEGVHQADYSGHDFEHIKRVWQNAQQILVYETEAWRDVVELAVILHDVDDYKLTNQTGRAKAWLEGQLLATDLIERILDIIDSTGFSKTGYNPQFNDIETKIVYDADKLDAIGAIGVARAFAFGGAKSRPLFDPTRLPNFELDLTAYAANSKSGNNHTVNHFFEKLIHLADLMQTSYGRKLAAQRKLTMLSFLEDFFREQNLNEWLEQLQLIQHKENN